MTSFRDLETPLRSASGVMDATSGTLLEQAEYIRQNVATAQREFGDQEEGSALVAALSDATAKISAAHDSLYRAQDLVNQYIQTIRW